MTVDAILARILSHSSHLLKFAPQPTHCASAPTREPVHIDLPEPPPLFPHLIAAGARPDVARAIHEVYYQRAREFREQSLAAISLACAKLAQIPVPCSDPSDKLLITTFKQFYLKKLDLWISEGVSLLQSRESSTTRCSNNGDNAESRTSKVFNHKYVPLLEHFFEENPFPTRADKVFLAKKSNMTYRQIHVWFQNRRNRTKKILHKKPATEGATLPLDTLIEKMGKFAVPPNPSHSLSSEQKTPSPRTDVCNVLDGAAPPHAFPTPYPSTCSYDPFPSTPVFPGPEWLRRPMYSSERQPNHVVDVDELAEKFSRLNLWDDSSSRSRRKAGKVPPNCYVTMGAITIKPLPAPHPACIRKPVEASMPRTTFQTIPATSSSHAFRSPDSQSPMVTLVPEVTRRRLAPLPKRSPRIPPFTHNREISGNSASSLLSSSSRSSSFSSQSSLQDVGFTFNPPSNPSSTCTTPETLPSPLSFPSDGPDNQPFSWETLLVTR